ncbi:MAG: hypothetical protein DRJ38_08480 [Thermoprotei archaeon]|nr:MAG: hypothetical protein DRJ38_08480 [Thermoprotei archaeon]
MKIATFTSGGKGGTGKTTLSSLLILGMSKSGIRTLLIDASSEGGASRLLLGNPEPPYLRDVFDGKTRLGDAIGLFEITNYCEFYMLPNIGVLPRVDLREFFLELRRFGKFFDLVIVDLPAFQDSWYHGFSLNSDIVVKVAEPNHSSFAACLQSPPENGNIVYVLNQPRIYPPSVTRKYRENLEAKTGSEVLVFPYEPAVTILNPSNAEKVLSKISPKFQDSLLKLGFRLAKPKTVKIYEYG